MAFSSPPTCLFAAGLVKVVGNKRGIYGTQMDKALVEASGALTLIYGTSDLGPHAVNSLNIVHNL